METYAPFCPFCGEDIHEADDRIEMKVKQSFATKAAITIHSHCLMDLVNVNNISTPEGEPNAIRRSKIFGGGISLEQGNNRMVINQE